VDAEEEWVRVVDPIEVGEAVREEVGEAPMV
jgi:hypothetical protein